MKTSTAHREDARCEDLSPAERRGDLRRSYPFMQQVAGCDEHSADGRRFETIRCHDVSRRGFSYWSDECPTAERVVVALGSDDETLHVVAKVCYAREVRGCKAPLWLVGCKLIARADS
jgi:hypothetical protein